MHTLALSLALSLGLPTAGDPSAQPAANPPAITDADVASLFAEPGLAQGTAAFEAERWPEAAAAFGRSKTPEARLMRGLALLEAQRGADAAACLASVPPALPEIADRIALWTGRGWAQASKHAQAAEAFGQVPATSLVWTEAQLSRARSLEALDRHEAALRTLEPLLADPPPSDVTRLDAAAAALLLTGRIRAEGKGDADRAWARRAFVECWAGHPLAPEAADCLAGLRRLAPPENAPPGKEETLRHAELLLDANRNAAALAELAKLAPDLPDPSPSEPLACRVRYALGKAYRKERKHSLAMETLRPVVERCEDAGLRVRALYVLASSASIAAPADAIGLYARLAQTFPAHTFADDALFFEADLLARAGRTADAKKVLSDLAERYPQGDYRAEALFKVAWLTWRSQPSDPAAASAILARLEAEYRDSDPYEYARAAYWRGRVLAAGGKKADLDEARVLWAKVVDRYPADYYGLLARARLAEAGVPEVRTAAAAAPAAAPGFHYAAGWMAQDAHFRAGLVLLRLGLMRSAAEELNAVLGRSPSGSGSGDGVEQTFLLAELLDRAGDPKSAHSLIRTLGRTALRQRPEGANLRLWRVAYPAAFRDEVGRWAPPAGVPVDLLQALMREESALDPRAISGAGAVGLTQLMLPTAQGLAKRHKLRRPAQTDLMRPEVNLRLGSIYLGELLRRFDGNSALALASYNAGENAVEGWLRARGKLPLDEFVEEIPIQETRGYVKRVLRSFAAYRLLYGSPGDRGLLLAQELPERK
jgi:soluble lytic murein transglycosylase